jgi:hypothetical protein
MTERNMSPQKHWPRVTIRFGLKIAVFGGFSVVSMTLGLPNPFFHLAEMAAILCIILALTNRNMLLGRSLGYWDEASWFALVACLG